MRGVVSWQGGASDSRSQAKGGRSQARFWVCADVCVGQAAVQQARPTQAARNPPASSLLAPPSAGCAHLIFSFSSRDTCTLGSRSLAALSFCRSSSWSPDTAEGEEGEGSWGEEGRYEGDRRGGAIQAP